MDRRLIEDSQVTVLLEIDGVVHMVGMTKDRYEVIGTLIKNATEIIIPTDKSQKQLRDFLGVK